MTKARDRASRSGSDPVITDQVKLGTGSNQVILKRSSTDGKLQIQTTDGSSTTNSEVSSDSSSGSGTTVYATISAMTSVSSPSTGSQAFVTANSGLYIYNGGGWYKIATVNTTPTISSPSNNADINLATDGTATAIEITASDVDEGTTIQYSYAVTTGSLTNGGGASATVTSSATSGGTYSALNASTNTTNRFFKITPTTNSAYAGDFSITFSATDSINSATTVQNFSLAFAVYGSVAFDGTGDYLTVPSHTDLQLAGSNFAVEFWINLPSAVASDYRVILGKGHNADNTREWYFEALTDQKLYFFWSTNGTGWNYVVVTTALSTGTWHHIALTRSGNTVKCYTDGKETYSNTSFSDTIHSGSQVVNIGGYNDGTALMSTSSLSNVRIVKGSAVYSVTGGSIDLTSSNANVSFATDADYLIGSSEDFTIEAWVHTPSTFALNGGKWRTVYFSGTNGELQIAYDTSGKPVLYSGSTIILATTASTASTWEHIAFTRTGSSMVFYRNGVANGTATNSSAHGANDSNHYIGAYSGTEGSLGGYVSTLRFVVGTGVYTGAFTPPSALTTSGGTYASTTNVDTSFTASHTMLLTGQSSSSVTDASAKNKTLTLGSSASADTNSPFITVPTAPLTAISGTSLLTCTHPSGTIADSSSNNHTITTNGDPTPSSAHPF